MTTKPNLIYFFLFLLLLPITFSISLQELLSSYDFSYSDDTINITNITHYGEGTPLFNLLIINLTANISQQGNYTFTGDLYIDDDLITTISDTYYLYNGQNTVLLYYNAKLLRNGVYNLTLTVQENYLTIYRKDNGYSFDFDNEFYEKPDVSIGINSFDLINNDADLKYEILRINTAINSTINGIFEINALMANSKTINSKKNYSLINGANNILIDFDGEEIRRGRINNSRLYLITIENGINYQFEFNYSLIYNLYDFDAGQSILTDSYSDGRIDSDGNNLSEFLEINISLDINESGTYSIQLELNDLYDNYVKKVTKEFSLNKGEQIANFRINGTDIYNSKINGPYLLEYVKLIRGNETLDSVSEPYITNNYNYDEFEKPIMPDLVINNLEINENNVKINLANEGDSYAFAFNVELFDDNFDLIGENLVDYLAPGSEKNISYNVNTSSIKKLYAIVDFDNEVEENNESNNLFTKDLDIFIQFNISLSNWNLISIPLNLSNKSVSHVLRDINYSSIYTYDNKWIVPDKFDPDFGYWIYVNQSQSLIIGGNQFKQPFSFNYNEKLIGYPNLSPLDLSAYSFTKNLSIFSYNGASKQWLSFNTLKEKNTLQYLEPGYGYWVWD